MEFDKARAAPARSLDADAVSHLSMGKELSICYRYTYTRGGIISNRNTRAREKTFARCCFFSFSSEKLVYLFIYFIHTKDMRGSSSKRGPFEEEILYRLLFQNYILRYASYNHCSKYIEIPFVHNYSNKSYFSLIPFLSHFTSIRIFFVAK